MFGLDNMQDGVSGLNGGCEGVAAEMIPTLVFVALLRRCFFSALKNSVVELGVVAGCLKSIFKLKLNFLLTYSFSLIDFQSITGFLEKVVLNLIDQFKNSSRTAEWSLFIPVFDIPQFRTLF